MALELGKEEFEYFKTERAWLGAPELELRLYFQEDQNPLLVYNLVNSLTTQQHFKGDLKDEKYANHVVKLNDSTNLAVRHWLYSDYHLTVPAFELVRLAGAAPCVFEPEEFREIDIEKFGDILEFLIGLTRGVHKSFELKYATIFDETCGGLQEDSLPLGIYTLDFFEPCIREKYDLIEEDALIHLPF